MSYPPYIYQHGPLAYAAPQEISNYYQLQLLEDDGNAGDMAMFDPMIQSHSPPPTQLQSPWTPPQQLQRFIGEKQKTPLFNASPSLQPFQNPSLVHGVTPLPPASHRQASPLPLTASSSSTCSTGLSPAGESDLYHENTPSTPSDYALTSPPYHTSSPPEMWPTQSQQQQQQLYLSGMARASPGDACVNPLDVNCAQDSQFDTFENDSNVLDFSPLQRGFSLQSCSSNSYEVDQPIQLPSELLKPHVSSVEVPQPESEDEVRTPDSRTHVYPRVEASGQAHLEDQDIDADADDNRLEDDRVNEDPARGVDPQSSYLKFEEDSDYQPAKRKRAASKSKRTKRNTPPTPTRPSSKRIKTTTATGPSPKPLASSTGALKTCQDCPRTTFKNEASLMEHRRKQHTRPFVCVFAFAGCESKFAAKNEWKRHVNSQHLLLTYWLCDIESCAKVAAASAGPSGRASSSGTGTGGCNSTGYSIPSGAVFNRKDLYTQHMRRMHTPPQIKKLAKEAKKAAAAPSSASGSKASNPPAAYDAEQIARWEERLKEYQANAGKTRCELPTYMSCPAAGCGLEFRGADAWDQRMEHVAKHLEEAVAGEESLGAIEFGGDGDPTLMEWAANTRVAVVKRSGGRWVLNNPLKDGPLGEVSADAASAGEMTVAEEEEGDEDAEGEDE